MGDVNSKGRCSWGMVFRFYRKGHRRCEVRKTWSIERLLLSVQGYFVVIVFGQKEGIFREEKNKGI